MFGGVYLTNYFTYDDTVFTHREPEGPPLIVYALFCLNPTRGCKKHKCILLSTRYTAWAKKRLSGLQAAIFQLTRKLFVRMKVYSNAVSLSYHGRKSAGKLGRFSRSNRFFAQVAYTRPLLLCKFCSEPEIEFSAEPYNYCTVCPKNVNPPRERVITSVTIKQCSRTRSKIQIPANKI